MRLFKKGILKETISYPIFRRSLDTSWDMVLLENYYYFEVILYMRHASFMDAEEAITCGENIISIMTHSRFILEHISDGIQQLY
jgi:hypothetical protein